MQVISKEDLLHEARRSNLKLQIVGSDTHRIDIKGVRYQPQWQTVAINVSNYIHPTSVVAEVCRHIESLFGTDNLVLVRRIAYKDVSDTDTRITFEVSTIIEAPPCA